MRERPFSILGVIMGLAVFFVLPAVGGSRAGAEEAGTVRLRRFALVAASNNGGSDRVRLMYAHSDARSLLRVLRQLGGVTRKDSRLLLDASRIRLLGVFDEMEEIILSAREPGVRLELVFYYSGHSDEKGLLLAGEHFS